MVDSHVTDCTWASPDSVRGTLREVGALERDLHAMAEKVKRFGAALVRVDVGTSAIKKLRGLVPTRLPTPAPHYAGSYLMGVPVYVRPILSPTAIVAVYADGRLVMLSK